MLVCRRRSCSSTITPSISCGAITRRGRCEDVFAEARRLTTWHYQWVILHEFLPLIRRPVHGGRRPRARATVLQPAERTRRSFPIEFQIAYRFGHSMVRPSYRANFTGNDGQPFFAMLFDPAAQGPGEPADLRGGFRSPRRFIGWQTFFRFPGFESDVRPNKRIDTKLSTPLFDLPLGAIAAGTPPTSLAERNLLRHLTWRIPSGQAIAAAMGERCAQRRRSRRPAADPPEVRGFDAVLVLRAQGGRGSSRRARISAPSAAASWRRYSSVCCRPTRTRS